MSETNVNEVVSYKCPNCGAPLTFHIETQRWDCDFCNSSFTKEELLQFNKNQGRETIEEASWHAEIFEDDDLVQYSCPNCGGRVMTEPNTVSTFCTYCHNPTVLASRLTGAHQPARILPFKVPKEHVLDSLRTLIRRKPLLPKSFREKIERGEITGLYVPFWLFSSTMDSTMHAEGLRITTWSDSNYNYTKTDTYAIRRRAEIPFQYVPVDASQRLDNRLMDSIEPFQFDDLTPFSMEYLSGHFAEGFDVDAQSSKDRFLQRANEAVEQIQRQSARNYSSVRILQLNSRPYGLDNLYAMLPVWTISVEYQKKIYTFAMNGQTGKSAGRLPISRKRVLAFFGGAFVLGLVISFLVVYFGLGGAF